MANRPFHGDGMDISWNHTLSLLYFTIIIIIIIYKIIITKYKI